MTVVTLAFGFLAGMVFWHVLGWWIYRKDTLDDLTEDARRSLTQHLDTEMLKTISEDVGEELKRRKTA